MIEPSIPRKKLDSWKEIADHCGRTVRTVQKWEKKLGPPVHRLGGTAGSRVFAYTDELELWLCQLAVRPDDGKSTANRFVRLFSSAGYLCRNHSWAVLAIGALLLLAALGLTVWTFKAAPMGMAYVRTAGWNYTGVDPAGQVLWCRNLGDSLAPEYYNSTNPLIADIDGDGRNEALIMTGTATPGRFNPCVLHCLEDTGRVRWKFTPGERVTTLDGEPYDRSWVGAAFLEDLDGDRRPEVVVLANHNTYWPALIAVLRLDGKVRGRYIHSGRFVGLTFTDLDGDGVSEILAYGTNNGYRQPSLAVLDSREVTGSSPQTDTPAFQIAGTLPGREKYYLLFPRDPINRACGSNLGTIAGVQLTGDSIRLLSCSSFSGHTGYLLFFLDRQMKLQSVGLSSSYTFLHDLLLKNKDLPRPYSAQELENPGPIRYWDGTAWAEQPTLTQYWLNRSTARLTR